MLYTAIGDSLTVGVGSTFFQPNFVRLYQQELEYYFRHPVDKRVFAKNGATTAEILASLSRPEVMKGVQEADVITVTGGGNDLLRAGKVWMKTGDREAVAAAIRNCLENMQQIVSLLIRLHSVHDRAPLIRVLNLYNPFYRVPESYGWLHAYNRELSRLEHHPAVRVADICQAFYGYEPYLLSIDHTHPNPVGYRVIARTVGRLGFAENKEPQN
ncbi:GDSL-type esterase/lipase family protein [Sporolactobacillus vineae]|uniref:GDSL-type esterase/lipase family protein n=1 Tax=Sporolactobacillus vineae TaxID=444463 RepID=UPI000289EC93|nr:GDSL-type esterase/lipase family protein [Sporolactobacillus vineae]